MTAIGVCFSAFLVIIGIARVMRRRRTITKASDPIADLSALRDALAAGQISQQQFNSLSRRFEERRRADGLVAPPRAFDVISKPAKREG